jgi:hypothetical protein
MLDDFSISSLLLGKRFEEVYGCNVSASTQTSLLLFDVPCVIFVYITILYFRQTPPTQPNAYNVTIH